MEVSKRIKLLPGQHTVDINVHGHLVVGWNHKGRLGIVILDEKDIGRLFDDVDRRGREHQHHHSKRRILHDL